jgi:hypothetical protein
MPHLIPSCNRCLPSIFRHLSLENQTDSELLYSCRIKALLIIASQEMSEDFTCQVKTIFSLLSLSKRNNNDYTERESENISDTGFILKKGGVNHGILNLA